MDDEMEDIKAELKRVSEQNKIILQKNKELQAGIVSADPSATSATEQEVASVGPAVFGARPNLAPFWLDRPAGWFAHVEAQFALAGITVDDTKYNYVVAQIDSRLSRDVEDLVTNPPAVGKYPWIKQEMIKRFSALEAQRVRQLLSGEELGDRQPSQFLRHLRSLAGNTVKDDKLLRELWLQRLPRSVQQILTAQQELPLEKVAEIADKILEVSPISANAISNSSSGSNLTPDINSLSIQIQALTKQVSELSWQRRNRPSRSRSRSKSTQSHRSPTPNKEHCWYHRRFKSKSTKCVKP